MSPDGRHVLGRVTIGGKTVLGVHSLSGAPLQRIDTGQKNDLRWYRWAGPGRILVSVARTVPYLGDEAVVTRLFVFDLATRALVMLGAKSQGLEGDDLLYTDPAGAYVLLSFQKTIYDYPSVTRVELPTNAMTEVVSARSDVWEWYADSDGIVRAGIGFDKFNWSMVYRQTAAEKFRKLGRAKYDDEDAGFDILRLARGTDEGFVLSNKATGRFQLHRYNYATRTLGAVVFANPTNDISDFDLTEDGREVRSVRYTDDRERIVWFDPKMKELQASLDKSVGGLRVQVTSRASEDAAMLVWTGASNHPGNYYVFRPDDGRMRLLAKLNDALKPGELAPSRYVTYKARDGLGISGYLTLPVGRDARGLPLVILPHGGPYGVRDRADYDAEVQFLANRGYAVLQPNFRGSEGYGKDFYAKGEGQWGRAMQDDLDDGMDWLAGQGIVDPKRVCVVGSSYGGYAALWGATRNPERYRCAASYAGVSDLGRQLRYQLAFKIDRRYRRDWRKTVQGDQDFDPKTVSPLFTVDRLKVPVLLAHGDADQTVPYRQSKLYVDTLRKAGKSVEFYTYRNEGHGLTDQANQKDWLDRLDAFLARHNPA